MVIAIVKISESGFHLIKIPYCAPRQSPWLASTPPLFSPNCSNRCDGEGDAPGARNRHCVAHGLPVASDSKRMEALDALNVSQSLRGLQGPQNLFDSLRMAGEDSPFVARFGESLQPLVAKAFNHEPAPQNVRP